MWMYSSLLELFASIALRTVGLQQLLDYDETTHCCETSAQTLAMWWASEHFLMLPSYLVRNIRLVIRLIEEYLSNSV